MAESFMTRPTSTLAAWYALVVLLLTMIISLVDRMVISLLVVPIQQDLILSDVQMGWVLGVAFGLFYSVMGMPLGYLSDRWHRPRLIAAGVFFWSLATLASGLATSFTELFVARMGVGVGEAVLAPAAWGLISDLFREEHRGRAFGIFQLGAVSGTGIGLLAGGLLFDVTTRDGFGLLDRWLSDLSPWRSVFVIAALLGAFVIPLILQIAEPRSAAADKQRSPSVVDALHFLFAQGRVLLALFVAMGCIILMIYSVSSWMPAVLSRQLELDSAAVGTAMGLSVLIGAVPSVVLGGWITDLAVARGSNSVYITLLKVSAVGMLLPLLLLPTTESLLGYQVIIGTFFFFACLPNGVLVAYIQRVTPPAIRGVISASYVLAVNVFGYLLGPTLIPIIAKTLPIGDGSLGSALLASGCLFSALASVILWGVGEKSNSLLRSSNSASS